MERLRSAPRGQLEAVLEQIDVEQAVDAICGNAVTGLWRREQRRELVQLLCVERAAELSPAMRARIVHALRRLPQSQVVSAGIRSMLLSLTGEPFRDMKYLLNATGDSHDLEHVVFERLTPADRDAVLAHIAAEAASEPSHDLRILCDIDDTLKAMLHERRYPHGTVYPGVVELLTALDDGRAAEPSRPGDLTFVTARPEGPRGLVEQYTRNALSGLGLPPHAVLGGSILNLFTKASIKERKLQNFERERALFPECRFMFLGDSGQADALVGAEMLRRGPEFVVAVLIHEVVPVEGAARAELEAAGIRFHSSYDEAARILHELGLLDQAGRDAVVRAVDEASGFVT
ncbi:phosphatase domain-containing protein [Agrococcus sp. Marseille-P2731]|uniref:phosphatase domain-containing protein n=1 Tax=Agrococcus sp. Marseille-P2731 TaxID=1841862 RepID=UPI000930AA43|nr:phosphatase domain-containing protein [Agrococcus sp. Marseille-P2731]